MEIDQSAFEAAYREERFLEPDEGKELRMALSPSKFKAIVCAYLKAIPASTEQPVGLPEGMKTTSDNGFHYQCKICGGYPTSFPYAPDPKLHSPAIGGKVGPRSIKLSMTGLCSAHRDGEDADCDICYPKREWSKEATKEEILNALAKNTDCANMWAETHQVTPVSLIELSLQDAGLVVVHAADNRRRG